MSYLVVGHVHRLARAVLALALCGLAATAGITVRPAGAAPPSAEAGPALDWVAHQVLDNGGSLPGFSPGSSDWGLTADGVLAFVAAGRSSDPAADAATDLLVSNAAEFTTWAPEMPQVRVAGATAKLLLAVTAMGRDATAVGVDLDSELRSLMVGDGAAAGRFADRVADPAWDSSNGFGQALALLALAMGPDGVPAQATSYLLQQQCPAGGFRLSYVGSNGCSSDGEADTDATAMALQALLAVPRSAEVSRASERAAAWLLSKQGSDGSFGGTGPTSASNSNSTGLIAQSLRAAGQTEAADRAAAWIAQRTWLDPATAEGTAIAAHVGAIAYQPASRATALVEGITDLAVDQWRRATVQGVLAFGLAPFGPGGVDPLPPVTTTTVPPSSTTTTTAPYATSTLPARPPTASPTPTDAPHSQVPRPVPPADASDVLDDTATTPHDRGRNAGSRLALTGAAPVPQVAAGISLILLGAAMCVAADRRRR